jgi:hypothetical protein
VPHLCVGIPPPGRNSSYAKGDAHSTRQRLVLCTNTGVMPRCARSRRLALPISEAAEGGGQRPEAT